MKRCLHMLLLFSCLACSSRKAWFTNPLLPSGADPWSIYHQGYYYYTQTLGDRLVIWKTRSIAELQKAESRVVFRPPEGKEYSKQLWAPEVHYIDSCWYLYFAADDGRNENHRLYVLQNRSADPMQGNWELKGRLRDPSDKWAIDGTVFRYNGKLYLLWSGWEGSVNGRQDLYISRMQNPWTLEGERVRISSPRFEWELHGDLQDPNNPPHVAVNEGPQFMEKGDKLFIVYSASGCWTDHYALGMLSAERGADLMDSASWTKHPQPVFKGSEKQGVYAPGHHSFFRSPDGREDWILYHANDRPGQGCGRSRSPRAQPFTWKADGLPDFGVPVKRGARLRQPAQARHQPTGPTQGNAISQQSKTEQ